MPSRSIPWRTLWRENPLRSALGKKLLMWFLLLSLVPLFVSNSVGYIASTRIIGSRAERDLEALTEVQAHHIRDEIERLQMVLISATHADRLLVASAAALGDSSTGPALLSGASSLAAEELSHLHRQLGTFSMLQLVTPWGTVVASAPRFGSGERSHDAGLVARATELGRAFELSRAPVTGDPSLLFATAMPAAGDQRPAVIIGTVAAADIGTALQIPPLAAGVIEAFVVDAAGAPVFVSHPRGPIDYRTALPMWAALARGAQRYRDAHDGDLVTTGHEVPGYPLHYVSAVPVRAALGELRGLRWLSILVEASFVFVLLGAAWAVSRGILRPVRQLVTAADRIGQGDLDARVDEASRDEVGHLAQRFNDMARQLRESADRIRQLHDEEMRRAEQLATVGELAAGVAHELKSPLLAIDSGVQLLSRRLAGSDAEGRRLAEETRQRVARMEGAVQELLNYARPTPARAAWLDLNAVVDRALRLVQPRAERSGVDIRRRLSDGLPSVFVDPEQINQVVVNLALNGIEAMRDGGHLEVATRSSDGAVELSVSDSGPGVGVEERDRIFRPFYTTKHTGTGLGLAIVRQVVDRHGGKVMLREASGGGAEFVVSLPVEAAEPVGREMTP